MLGLLAHTVHYLLVVLGLIGVGLLLFPQLQEAARGSRRTTYHPPASRTEHDQRIAALRHAVRNGTLATAGPTTARAIVGRSTDARDGSAWRAVAVAGSVAAAGVHAAVFPHHLEESVVVGTFFLLVTLSQAAWACLVTIDAADDRVLVAGIVGSLGLVALWTFSRTVGIGWFGLGREAVGGWDIAAAVWELAVVGACLVGLRRSRSERALVIGDLGRTAWVWVLASGVVLVVLTLTASHT